MLGEARVHHVHYDSKRKTVTLDGVGLVFEDFGRDEAYAGPHDRPGEFSLERGAREVADDDVKVCGVDEDQFGVQLAHYD